MRELALLDPFWLVKVPWIANDVGERKRLDLAAHREGQVLTLHACSNEFPFQIFDINRCENVIVILGALQPKVTTGYARRVYSLASRT